MTVEAIYRAIDEIAPFSESMDFDNTGILVGDPQAEVTDALLCLDVTMRVLREALDCGAGLIISHHPVIFHKLGAVLRGDIVYELARSGVSVISAHTNLDKAYPFGINHALAERLGLHDVRGIIRDGNACIAYMGELAQPMTEEAFGAQIKEALGLPSLRYTPANHMVCRVAVVGGAGGEYALEAAGCGADAFVTGEVRATTGDRGAGVATRHAVQAGHYHTGRSFTAGCSATRSRRAAQRALCRGRAPAMARFCTPACPRNARPEDLKKPMRYGKLFRRSHRKEGESGRHGTRRCVSAPLKIGDRRRSSRCTRVDMQIFSGPNRDELIFAFRGFDAAYKLLISARANSARINLTKDPVENPLQPPMLCMLLEKLRGAKLLGIQQPDMERALLLRCGSVSEARRPRGADARRPEDHGPLQQHHS